MLEVLQKRLAIYYPDRYDRSLFRDAREDVSKFLRHGFKAAFDGSLDSETAVRYRCSREIGKYVDDVELTEEPAWPGGPHVTLRTQRWHEVQILKEISQQHIFRRPDVALVQRGQAQILRGLVELLTTWVDSKTDYHRLPKHLRDELDIAQALAERRIAEGFCTPSRQARGDPRRCIIDYICSFTDEYCASLFQTLSGTRLGRLGWRSFT